MNTQFSEEKFKELILYVANRSLDDPSFGMTKLYKVLYFCDFLAYAYWGAPITGATYQKLEHGPAPRQALPILDQLKLEGSATTAPATLHGYPQKRVIALRDPNLTLFAPQEIALIDEIIEGVKFHTAKMLSVLTHETSFGWQAVQFQEDIPYGSVFISPNPPSAWAIERTRAFAKEHGLMESL